ncbi:hypothetical protein HLPCO_001498 [Haloplasma contractile SSD-17B]|uniref:Uncharacterized protein n=1 Tax=Haloplasma contractile SSD-17B TaxID=1033810 RepID=F7PWW1_9MOLU|nr:hypothetical protein HLPCO_001498 [Haloplasma contractile SSD-17B]
MVNKNKDNKILELLYELLLESINEDNKGEENNEK